MSTLRVGVPVGSLSRSATGTGGSPSGLVSAVGMADAQAEAAGLLLTQPQHHQLGDAQAQAEAAGAARQGQGQGLEGGAAQEAVGGHAGGRGSPRGSGMLGMLFGDVDEVVNRLWRRVGFGPGHGCAMSEAKPAERDLPPQ
jgi:hypothetical protein